MSFYRKPWTALLEEQNLQKNQFLKLSSIYQKIIQTNLQYKVAEEETHYGFKKHVY